MISEYRALNLCHSWQPWCNFTFNTHIFSNTVAVDQAASQELLAPRLSVMDQQHETEQWFVHANNNAVM